MDEYHLLLKPSVLKDMQEIPTANAELILQHIGELASNPYPLHVAKLSGAHGTYRIRVRDYRVLYEIDTSEKCVTILAVKHRRDAYRSI